MRKETCEDEPSYRTKAEPGFNREAQKGDLPSLPRRRREWRRQHQHSTWCEYRRVALAKTASICTVCCLHKEMFWKCLARRVPRSLSRLQSYQRFTAQQVYSELQYVCVLVRSRLLLTVAFDKLLLDRRCRVLSNAKRHGYTSARYKHARSEIFGRCHRSQFGWYVARCLSDEHEGLGENIADTGSHFLLRPFYSLLTLADGIICKPLHIGRLMLY